MQRHVDALPESPGGGSGARVAGVGPFPHHDTFESGGGSGAASAKHPLTGGEPAEGAAPQAQRWPLAAPGSRVRGRARQKLHALLVSKLATGRAWELKETFSHFWDYKSVTWAGAFLTIGAIRALRSDVRAHGEKWPACYAPMRSYC